MTYIKYWQLILFSIPSVILYILVVELWLILQLLIIVKKFLDEHSKKYSDLAKVSSNERDKCIQRSHCYYHSDEYAKSILFNPEQYIQCPPGYVNNRNNGYWSDNGHYYRWYRPLCRIPFGSFFYVNSQINNR
jgi:hypothetical protein